MDADTRKTLERMASDADATADVIARNDPKRMAVSEAVRGLGGGAHARRRRSRRRRR